MKRLEIVERRESKLKEDMQSKAQQIQQMTDQIMVRGGERGALSPPLALTTLPFFGGLPSIRVIITQALQDICVFTAHTHTRLDTHTYSHSLTLLFSLRQILTGDLHS